MGKSDMFAVRGITPEARKAAKMAAAAAGATLGRWLSEAILDCAAEQEAQRQHLAKKAPKIAETVANKECLNCRVPVHTTDGSGILLNEDGAPHICGDPPSLRGEVAAGAVEAILAPEVKPKRRTKKPKQCQHGTAAGYNCWKCGGLVRVE